MKRSSMKSKPEFAKTQYTVRSTAHCFHLQKDSSNIGTVCTLVEQLPEGKRKLSFSSSHSILIQESTIKLNRQCINLAVSCVGLYQQCKHKNTKSLDQPSRPILITLPTGKERTYNSPIFQTSSHHYHVPQSQINNISWF